MKHQCDRMSDWVKRGWHPLSSLPFLTLFWACNSLPTNAQLIIPANDGTGTVLLQDNDQFTINGGLLSENGRNLFHSFTEFGLSRGQTATFLTRPTIHTILTRVTGGQASLIDGLIQVSGGNTHLILMNPTGILFGPNARLNVPASFMATTANRIGFGSGDWWSATGVTDSRRLNGLPTEFAFTTESPGAIANLGTLSVPPGQSLTLLAGSILNQGQLIAPGGQVTVASVPGHNLVRLTPPGTLLSLEIRPFSASREGDGESGAVLNGLSLPQLLTGGGLTSASHVVVNPDGSLRLTGSTAILPTAPGTTVVSGQVSVGQDAIAPAGVVTVLGEQVALIQANVNASGLQGGTVRIGGDHRGHGNLPNARMTTIDPETVITANGVSSTQPAPGGQVVIWANDTTRFYGAIAARGGDRGGDGGFVEVSGKQQLLYRGQTDVAAPSGQAGTLLLDPTNIRIVPGTIAPNDFDLFADGQIFANEPGDTFTISQDALESATGNIVLEATNDISVVLPPFATLEFSSGALSVTFRADADRDGIGHFSSPAGVLLTTDPTARTDIDIRAATISVGDIDTSVVFGDGGNVTLAANRTIQVGQIDTRSRTADGVSGAVTLSSGQGQITTGDILTAATGTAGVGGNVTVISERGGITTGRIDTGGPFLSGDVTLLAPAEGQNIRFASIDAASRAGIGGDVEIQAGRFVQGTEVIQRLNQPTIDAAGAITSGTVVIQHGGGIQVPFVVGAASDNGTVGAIDTRTEILNPPPPLIFRGQYRSPLDTIQILTDEGGPGFLNDLKDLLDDPLEALETDFEIDSDLAWLDLQTDTFEAFDDEVVTEAEEEFTDDFQTYLELPGVTNLRPDANGILQQVAAQTGIKSALVYLSFAPANVATTTPQSTAMLEPRKWHHQVDRAIAALPGRLLRVDGNGRGAWPEGRDGHDRWLTQAPSTAAPPSTATGQDQLEIVIVTGDGPPIRKWVAGATRDRVQATARQFLNEVADPRKTRTRTYLAPAQQLYRWFIQPIEAELRARGITNMAFIADTGLRFIPFAALHDGQQFLIEKFSLGLMPSLSLTDPRFVSLKQARVLAMGASMFANQDPLPAVPTELALITETLRKGRSFLNQEFTLTNLQTQRQQELFQIVHLATHGSFQSGALSNSYIQLWDTQLRMDQLRQLGWSNPPVELLVLSACQTALGSEEAELGFAGFAVQAGVRSAMASLWNVSDEGTLGLMTEFYRQLDLAPIRTEALRQAQMAMAQGRVTFMNGRLQDSTGQDIPLPPTLTQLDSRNLSHPYYWSAFTMIGSPW